MVKLSYVYVDRSISVLVLVRLCVRVKWIEFNYPNIGSVGRNNFDEMIAFMRAIFLDGNLSIFIHFRSGFFYW